MIYWGLMKRTNQVCARNWTLFTTLLPVLQSLRQTEVFGSQTNYSFQLVLFSELVELVYQIRLNRVKTSCGLSSKDIILMWAVDAVWFSGAATEFCNFCDSISFYKQGPVWCRICSSFDTERWSGPSDERYRSWFGTTFCWQSACKCLQLFSSAHGVPPEARLFTERTVNLNLSFINMIKLWLHFILQYVHLQVLTVYLP